MNKKIAERWEVRLGIVQVIMLLGVVTGCMTFAFYMGYFSGKETGYELAMDTNAASGIKIPINAGKPGEPSAVHKTEQAVTDVLAKLNEKPKEGKIGATSAEEVPELGSIKESEGSMIPPQPPVLKKEVNELGDPWEKKGAEAVDPHQKVLADEEPAIKIDTKGTDSKAAGHDAAKKLFEGTDGPSEVRHEPEAAKSKDRASEEQKKAAELALKEKEEAQKKAEAAKKEEQLRKEEQQRKDEQLKKEKEEAAKKEEALRKAEAEAKKKEAEEKKKEAPKAATEGAGIVRGAIPSGWFAQVAAPTQLKDAEALAGKLKSSGFHVVIENAKVRGDDYFRILVGPEQNKQQAEALVGQLRRESYIQGVPFIRMVK